MASGPYFDKRRGTWSVQWWNGIKWCRPVVAKKQPGWVPGMPEPRKPPPTAIAALGEYTKKEQMARERRAPAPEQTIAAFLGSYLETYTAARDPGSAKELSKAIKVFLDWCKNQDLGKVSQVDSSACHRWISDRAAMTGRQTGRPIQRSTLIKERALLAAAWSQAARRGEIATNPWVAAPIMGRAVKKERKSWSPEEYKKLLDQCSPWLRDLIILGCHSGLRIEALRCLEWRDIVWVRPGEKGFGWIVVRPELDKAKNGYRVPMNAAANELLKRRHLHREAGTTFVLLGKQGRPMLSNSTSDRAIRLACKNAGLKEPDSPNHHMRRTFGRWAVMGHLTGKPVPLYVVSQWYGHATIAMTMKYLDMREDDSTRFMLGEDTDDLQF